MAQAFRSEIAKSEKTYYAGNFSTEIFRQPDGIPPVSRIIYTKEGFPGSPNITSSLEIRYQTGFECTPKISVLLLTSEWVRDNEKANVFKGAVLNDGHALNLIVRGLLDPVDGYIRALSKMDAILLLERRDKKAARTFGHYFLPEESSTETFRNTIKTLSSVARSWQ